MPRLVIEHEETRQLAARRAQTGGGLHQRSASTGKGVEGGGDGAGESRRLTPDDDASAADMLGQRRRIGLSTQVAGQPDAQAEQRFVAVAQSLAMVVATDFATAGRMHQPHAAGRAVGMLAARTSAAHGVFATSSEQLGRGQRKGRKRGLDGMHHAPYRAASVIMTRTDTGELRLVITDLPIFQGFTLADTVSGLITAKDREVILDVSMVEFLHSPVLANLVTLYVRLTREGRSLTLAGLTSHNRKILSTTQLDRLFGVS